MYKNAPCFIHQINLKTTKIQCCSANLIKVTFIFNVLVVNKFHTLVQHTEIVVDRCFRLFKSFQRLPAIFYKIVTLGLIRVLNRILLIYCNWF